MVSRQYLVSPFFDKFELPAIDKELESMIVLNNQTVPFWLAFTHNSRSNSCNTSYL
ncbi:unnamed protein product [Acanthoscelides obtectus]|uniref:Uncharacterized protein n=1 Tax=Acanthoscelides obtectus TaxID=200917 RepID=A0A9P0L9R6_ACAOB|nr:unnamed protein product [Acanthoscelides obtectus]CAK1635671.1 hypothetical protein AOBTE_LOCUS9428 [Acanthoscelides obtectus]